MSGVFKWINLGMFIAMIAVNAVANMFKLNGMSTGEVSSRYASAFTPAPITFSIWGVIYILLAILIVMQLFDVNVNITEKMGIWFAVSCMFNIAWIVTWHYNLILLSMISIVGLMLSLLMIMMGLTGSGFASIVFSIYAGWILVANIANAFVLAVSYGFNGMSMTAYIIAIVAVLLAGMAGGFIVIQYGNFAFAGAIAWGLCGIFLKNSVRSSIPTEGMFWLGVAAIVGVAFIIGSMFYESVQYLTKQEIGVNR